MSVGTLWWDAGFEALVSIIPPDAEIAPTSAITEKARGKAPGLYTPKGWVGYDWIHRTPSRANVATWQAGIGLRTDRFPAIDIDVLDAATAATLEQMTRDILGEAPCRIGRAPKRLLLYRTDAPMPKRRLEWMMDGERQALEVLSAGSQCVVTGIHPATLKPYTWEPIHPVLFGAEALTLVTPEKIEELFAAVEAYLAMFDYPRADHLESREERQEVAQEQLMGELEAVASAVRSIPNTTESHPTRDDYLMMGYAIKAALPAFPDDAFELWCEWAERWDGGANEMTTLEADWKRMKPPFSVGAQYLYDLAAKAGDTSRTALQFTFEDEPPTPERIETALGESITMFSDAWLAARFLKTHGHEMRFCPALGGWMYWDSTRWVRDDLDLVGAWAARIGRDAAIEAKEHAATPTEERSLPRWCSSERAVQQMLAYASRHPKITARVEDFDRDVWALNTPNGILDLRDGSMRHSNPESMVTKCTSVSPSAEPAMRWLQFLTEATGGDAPLQSYLQRLFGYALTGSTSEEMLAFFWGSGGNGKSVLLSAISKIMGSYATTAPMETFTASKYERHPTDLAGLAGARLVVANETQEGRSWDEAKIKSLTGSDAVSARFMRQDFFTYTPQFKLLFAGNHRPNLQAPDAAMLRRFHLVPFNQVPVVVDTRLKDKLQAEYPSILGWMIEGCRLWSVEGLHAPRAVEESTEEYFRESDPFGRWMEERCELATGAKSLTRDLFTDFRHWCITEGEEAGTQHAFTRGVKKRGVWAWRDPQSRERGFQGLRLRTSAPDARSTMLLGESPPISATQH